MSKIEILKNLNTAYKNILSSIESAKREALKYEIFMSENEHSSKKGVVVSDIDNYFNNLLQKNAKAHHN